MWEQKCLRVGVSVGVCMSFWNSFFQNGIEGRHGSGMQPNLVHVTLLQCTKLFSENKKMDVPKPNGS